MSNISPLINVMKTAYNKVNRRINRDFGEIENLQGLDEKIEKMTRKSRGLEDWKCAGLHNCKNWKFHNAHSHSFPCFLLKLQTV